MIAAGSIFFIAIFAGIVFLVVLMFALKYARTRGRKR